MLVTQILPLDKKRSRVWLDEEFAFVLYRGELRRFNISEGKELAPEIYNEIMKELLPKRAKLRAMNLLKNHAYSVAQLKNKLRESYYPEELVEEAVDYVDSYGYVDDQRLSEEYIRIHLQDKSRMRIKQDLIRRGISTEIIESAFDNCEEEGFRQDESGQIKELLRKRGFDSGNATAAEWARQYGFLVRRGFSPDLIRSALGDL